MTEFFHLFLVALGINCGVSWISYANKKKSVSSNDKHTNGFHYKDSEIAQSRQWQRLLKNYLIVYLLATASDWLQGPYVYALYSEYDYSRYDIAVLFVAGFGSSMVFGSFVGGMADWGGRRLFVVIYALIYASSCVTKHFREFSILMLGRLLGGVSTSLLYSVFEAWLIRSHSDAGLKAYIGKSFAWAAYMNSIVAILAGLVANQASNSVPMTPIQEGVLYVGGCLNPFDLALVSLVSCGLLATTLWDENYGDTDPATRDPDRPPPKWYDGLHSAFVTTVRSTDILLCGTISSLFEGSMYLFVFMWTPALTGATHKEEHESHLPFGLIFSTFMVCCMAGSSIYGIAIDMVKAEALAVYIFAAAAAAMGCVALSTSQTVKFIAMNVFEIIVGMYWPVMGTMKGSIVPESKRAAIYNLYRIPLNSIVLFSLLTGLTPTQSFQLNCFMLMTASVLQFILKKRRSRNGLTETAATALSEPLTHTSKKVLSGYV